MVDDSGGADGAGEPLPRHREPAEPGARRHSDWRGGRNALIGLWVVRVLSATLACALLIACAYGFVTFHKLDHGLHRLTLDTGVQPAASTTGDHAADDSHQVKRDVDGKDQNILVVGNDDRTDMTDKEVRELGTGRDGGSINTDTMMIVHAPADGSTATLISFPRDSWVNIPGYGMNRLNAAYAFGYQDSSGDTDAKRAAGANLLIKTITELTGLTIDHFVQVGLVGFVRISNAIGGVPINLCNAVDDAAGSHLVMSAGQHRIEGVTALEFVRQREGLTNGDFDRVARQRYFITAAFRQITSAGVLLNPGKLNALVAAIDKSIYVDSGFHPLKFAAQVGSLNANNIVGQTIPFVQFEKINGSDVNIVDPVAVKDFVTKLIDGTDSALAKAKTVDPSTVTVSVLNSGAAIGAAATNAATLTQAGFEATSGDYTGAPMTATTIRYARGMESQAKTLATYVKGAVLDRTATVSTLTLVIGSDGKNAQATPVHKKKAKAIDAGCIN